MALQKTFNQRDFSSGQYDREYRSVHDEVTQRGMMYSRNLLSSVLGEVKTRPGFLHRLDLEGRSSVIPYRDLDRDVFLVFSDNALDLYVDNGNEYLDRHAQTAINQFAFPNTNSNNQGGVILNDNSNDPTNLYQSFTRPDWDDLSAIPISFRPGFMYFAEWNFGEGNQHALFNFIFRLADRKILTSGELHDHKFRDAFVQTSDDGVNWNTVRSELNYLGGTRGSPRWRMQVLEYRESRFWRVGFSLINVRDNQIFLQLSDFNHAVATPTTRIETPYAVDDLQNLKFDQSDRELCIVSKNPSIPPYKFSITSGNVVFNVFNPNIFEQYGNPKCVRYFQNRLWFGGFDAYPIRVISTVFGDYTSFNNVSTALTTVVSAADGIVVESNQLSSMITNLYGGNSILYATSHDGISMIEAGGAIIGVNQINFSLKSDQRTSDIPPVVKNNTMFMVSEDREKIFALDFDLNTEKFIAPEISVYAKDILVNKIRRLIDVDTREKMIYGLLDNGEMFGLLYENSPQRLGFFPIDTNGTFNDLIQAKFAENNYLYAVTQRNTGYVIERLQQVPKFMPTDEFGQTQADKNRTTKFNLMDTFYFDNVRQLKQEVDVDFLYNDGELFTNFDLRPYIGKLIRCFYTTNALDFIDMRIEKALGANHFEVDYESEDDISIIKIQLPLSEIQPIDENNYNIVIRDTSSEEILLFTQNSGGEFSYELPPETISIRVLYAGANGRRAWYGIYPVQAFQGQLVSGRGALKEEILTVTGSLTITGTVGALGSVPNDTLGTGGVGYTNGSPGQGVRTVTPPIGSTRWASGGGGGGSTAFSFNGVTYEASGGGGAGLGVSAGQNTARSFGGNGGGLFGGLGGNPDTAGLDATDPEMIGTNEPGMLDGYILVYGRQLLAPSEIKLTDSKLMLAGFWETALDSHIGESMRFFPNEFLTDFVDLRLIDKDTSDPENPFINVEILNTVNMEITDEMAFIIVRNIITFNGTLQFVDTGRYVGEFTAENNKIKLPFECFDLRYGYGYTKIGVIQENNSYLRKRKWGTVALNVMDTMSLQIGSRIDRLEDVMDFQIDDFYDASPIMRNGVVSRNIADDYEQDKILIFKTEEGLPFCIRAIEASGEITDRNTN